MESVARLIIYDSKNEKELAHQLELSLDDGIHHLGGVQITIITLSSKLSLNQRSSAMKKTFDANYGGKKE
jgi:hypothetical protein